MIRRHVATIGTRQVHYRRAGSGPALVVLHQSPRSSLEMVPLMTRLSDRYTVFAPDTPGNGMSDPLPGEGIGMTDFGDALAEFLTAVGVERALVYGFHTGAMCAFAIAWRHPERVAGAIINGYVHPCTDERADLEAHYFTPFVPEWSGSHLVWAWARMREQYIFYPWYRKNAAARIAMPDPTPERIHEDVMDLMRAGDSYRAPYRAAFTMDLTSAASEIHTTTLIMTMRPDWPLLPHLANMPAPSPAVAVAIPESFAEAMALLDAALARGAAAASLPAPASTDLPLGNGARGHFVAVDGGDLFLRFNIAGDDVPLVIFHDAGGSSTDAIAAMVDSGRSWFAFDLPGHGESDGFAGTVHPEAIAALVGAALDRLEITSVDLIGHGAGGAVATALASARPDLVHALTVDRLCTAPYPEYPLEAGGLHLMRAWGDLRDQALQNADLAALDPARLQQRVVDRMKARDTAPAFARAAAAHLL